MKTKKEVLYVVLVMMFAGALVTANVVAFKMFTLGWHWFDKNNFVAFNVGTFCYAITLLISNLINYWFGEEKAKYTIVGGFAAQIISTLLIVVLRFVPCLSVESQNIYVSALGQNWAMVIGSLAGYLFCQFVNYVLFNKLRNRFNSNRARAIYNFGSNAIGQLVDTIVFDLVAFGLFNAANGYGYLFEGGFLSLIDMIIFSWLFKVLVSLIYSVIFHFATIGGKNERTAQ